MDFFFRKIVRDQGTALGKLLSDVQETTKAEADDALARRRSCSPRRSRTCRP
jgi:hypothetical protein